MADPTPFRPGYSYSGWQATNPSKPLPGPRVDDDFANISRTVNETIAALKNVRRSDGALANESVGPDQLSSTLSIGFTLKGSWQEFVYYSAGDGVIYNNAFYSARQSHTASGSTAPGNESYWNFLFSMDDIVIAGALSMPRNTFVGDGVTASYELSFTPTSERNLLVSVGGLLQAVSQYTVAGAVLTFLVPPPAGYDVEIRGFATTAAVGEPADGSITEPKLSSELADKVNSAVQAGQVNKLGIYDTQAEFALATVPLAIQRVTVGTGVYKHDKVRIATPGAPQAWHSQSADGAWWVIAAGQFITPYVFGEVDNTGVEDASSVWASYDAFPGGVQHTPIGTYKLGSSVNRFDRGIIGNGRYDNLQSAWDQPVGDFERQSLIVHGRTIDVDLDPESPTYNPVSPAIKLQTIVNFEDNTPTGAFKHVVSGYHDVTLNGYYNTDTDQNNNFTGFGSVIRNNMAGLFGSLSGLMYVSDAKESENPNIVTMGASKNGCLYLQPTRRARYSSGGYMFGAEVIVLNTSDDSDTAIPYASNDEFNYESWTAAHKMSVQTNSCPASTIILMTGSTTARHGTYAGVTIGASLWAIDGNRQGPAGTVGINMASWRAAVGFADIGIKFREANRHIYGREGLKIRSSRTRFIYENGAAGVSIEGQTGQTQYLDFLSGATSAADGGSGVTTGRVLSSSSQLTLEAPSGELIFSPVGVASWRINSARLAPVTTNAFDIGSGSVRVKDYYGVNAPNISSDERVKTNIDPISDDLLDVWGEFDFSQYRLRASVEEKGEDARVHAGVIAQRLVAIFESRGWKLPAFICHDKWDAVEDRVEVTPVETKPAKYEQKLVKPATYRKHIERVLVEEPTYREETDKSGKTVLVEATPAKYKKGEEVLVEVDPPQYEDGKLLEPAEYKEIRTVVPGHAAGDRYGIRYEELLCIEAAYQRRRAERMEQRLTALENRLNAALSD